MRIHPQNVEHRREELIILTHEEQVAAYTAWVTTKLCKRCQGILYAEDLLTDDGRICVKRCVTCGSSYPAPTISVAPTMETIATIKPTSKQRIGSGEQHLCRCGCGQRIGEHHAYITGHGLNLEERN